MIVFLKTAVKKRCTRIKLYKDDVFLIALETIKKYNIILSIEELFASTDRFVDFLLKNDIKDRDIMQYELDALREEVSDEQTFNILLSLSYVKMCALRKAKPNAESIARTLVGFCQDFEGFSAFLKQLANKELIRYNEGKRTNLLAYELKSIGEDDQPEDTNLVVNTIVDVACGLTPEGIQHIENVFSEVNDKFDHRYQEQLDCLRETRKKKTVFMVNLEKLNDIHDNPTVNINGIV